jgi:uncharacterized membrane protein
MKDRLLTLRTLGILVLLVSAVMAYLIFSYMNTLGELTSDSCTCGDVCTMVEYKTPSIVYVGFLGVFFMLVVGAFLFIKGGPLYGTDLKESWKKNVGVLDTDEKAVYQLMIDAGGTAFQSEVVEKTGWSKVKVTRTLDKLESRRLLERRRRGLTNIIVLK